ncbi:MAG: SusE domain-containing protein [Muribaculaceae bacterium]|nr:SusE domain-containing protein [Muribaculaceae bacterium]
MKKSYIIGLAALAVCGMTACQDDQDPKISTPTEFVLNVPPLAEQTLILTPEGTSTFTVSQPNYGLTLAPTYGLEVSLKEDFTPIIDGTYINAEDKEVAIPGSVVVPIESQIGAALVVKQSNLAAAICSMRGIGNADDYTEEDPRPLYVRANAIVGNSPSTAITSNTVTLKNVQGYCSIETAEIGDVLYTPGNANGWNHDACMKIPASDENVYEGYMVVDGGFKFTANPNWSNPGNYGCGPEFTQDENGTWNGTLVENAGDFTGLESGLYWVKVEITNTDTQNDEEAGTVSLTPIKTIGIVGNAMGWENDIEMTPETGFTVWKAENVDLGDGGWKFRMNNAWALNLGGTLKKLTQNGDNLTEGGVHTVIIDFSTLPYSARLE